jgi:hypothetical protein
LFGRFGYCGCDLVFLPDVVIMTQHFRHGSALLLLSVLVSNAGSAPRLKDKKPTVSPEIARVEALRAKYDAIRRSGDADEKMQLRSEELALALSERELELLAQLPMSAERIAAEQRIRHRIQSDVRLQELFDIKEHDRQKAADAKTTGPTTGKQ